MSFEEYVERAVQAASTISDGQSVAMSSHPLLNGVPYSTFRREVGIDTRREIGAFFSSHAMASALSTQLEAMVADNALVLDPTCGIGDLLLARAAALPLGRTMAETLSVWGDCLAGFDIRGDLVRLCKVRLCMLARARGGFAEQIYPLQAFPNIVKGDMLAPESQGLLARADAILFNPPFGKTTWPEKLDWASGEINAAAIFIDRLTTAIRPTVPISAVLPEVLRCGSRYERFRSLLSERGYAGTFEVRGRFDSWTDVDVFTTLLTRSETHAAIWRAVSSDCGSLIKHRYEVRVGSVVPHRDLEGGASRPYICAKTTPAWDAAFVPSTRRLHSGRVFTPPFVAIRRTSSPSDKFRAVATVVTGVEPVAVENHLLIATPRDMSLASCMALMCVLRDPRTNDRLNELMRCRHLTTGAINNLPWTLSDE